MKELRVSEKCNRSQSRKTRRDTCTRAHVTRRDFSISEHFNVGGNCFFFFFFLSPSSFQNDFLRRASNDPTRLIPIISIVVKCCTMLLLFVYFHLLPSNYYIFFASFQLILYKIKSSYRSRRLNFP